MERLAIARLLGVALSNLIVDDWRLLAIRTASTHAPVSERSIAFALGWQLKAVMESSWDVDCEYNRRGAEDAVAYKRRLAAQNAAESTPPVVFPDLIVHRRGLDGSENNLLVLELKTNHEHQGPAGGSEQSLGEIQRQFGYQHAVLLDLRLSRNEDIDPHWTWIYPGGLELSVPMRVYSTTVALDVLKSRGRKAEAHRYGLP